MAPSENRLAHETSPYLLQHAHNPVDWYPWGVEAFAAAREGNKPILLSVGYSACHWCHVMERESFEDEETARLMNDLFISVKVDREERPDVDEIYMQSVQLLTGRGGWPMTVFLTPAGEPFYGGTYFPPEDRHGLPGFRRVLHAVADAYRERPEAVADTVQRLLGAMKDRGASPAPEGLDGELPVRAVEALSRAHDSRHGGFGQAPKFPNTMVLSLFLRAAEARCRANWREIAAFSLRKMADGGIYDHLGGGFHRYSVDERWLVPHFEKMLYDNAQLAALAVEVFRASQDRTFLELAEDVLRYVGREMLAPEGGFYSTQDADSEGHEGKFFLWDLEEVTRLLGEGASEPFCRVYDVTDAGNFEGRNILHRTLTDEQAGRMFGTDTAGMAAALAEGRDRLFTERETRVKPFRDEKILTSWNGLMLSAYAVAYGATGNVDYLEACQRTVAFLERHLRRDGRWLHVFKDGRAAVPAFLDDYAALGVAHLDLLDATFDTAWLTRATEMARALIDLFWDESEGGFFFTATDHERLIVRTKPVHDGSAPSGTSMATHLFLRLHVLTGEAHYRERAERTLRLYQKSMAENPFAHAHLLAALDRCSRPGEQIVVVARGGAAGAATLLDPLRVAYAPNRTVFYYDPEHPPAVLPTFAQDKPMVTSRPTAYVCREFTCSAPVTEWSDLRSLLKDTP